MALTPKQKDILDFISEQTNEKGFAPSQKEIAKHFGYSSLGTVQNYLVRLERNGYLEKPWNAKRGMKVNTDHSALPLLGRVAAGRPIETMLHNETVDVPISMLTPSGDFFALQVKGDSMINDGIMEDDIVVIRKQITAFNGQTVVALIDNEATIKCFFKKKDGIELHSANPKYKPIIVKPNQSFSIEGILHGLIRKFKR